MKVSKEVRVGIIVVVSVALFIYGYNFLKGNDLFSRQTTLYGVYNNIGGLVESAPVTLNGFKVGLVKKIQLLPGDVNERILVSFLINNDVPVSKNSIARIVDSGLLGGKEIQLLIGDGKETVQNGDTLSTAIVEDLKTSVSNQIAPLKIKAESLISSIDSVMSVIQVVMNKDARENLSKSFASIKHSLETFEKTSLRLDTLVASQQYKISSIFSKIESITGNLANNNDKLTKILTNFASISDSLAKSNLKSTINNANLALADAASIMNKIKKGEGSVGMLINNDSLYRKLDSSAAGLDKLMEDIRINPDRYLHFSVFGKKDRNKPKAKSKP